MHMSQAHYICGNIPNSPPPPTPWVLKVKRGIFKAGIHQQQDAKYWNETSLSRVTKMALILFSAILMNKPLLHAIFIILWNMHLTFIFFRFLWKVQQYYPSVQIIQQLWKMSGNTNQKFNYMYY